MMGTVGYMSPEQVRGQSVDHRSDIFSFGVVLYELLGGSHPFGRETPADALAAILDREPTDLGQLKPELPPALVGVVTRCLEKEPWKRHASAQALVDELEQSLSEDAEIAAPIAGPEFLSREGAAPREEPAFVGREEELGRLRVDLERAVSGDGRVVFVAGDPGSGKTALVSEFARRAQSDHLDLVVASGKCNAHTGVGDPYLPFREVLGLLTGDVESLWSAGVITRGHALRLWQVVPDAVRVLVDSGPDLIDTFVAGRALVTRARSSGVGARPAWLVKLRQLVEQKAALSAAETPQQSDLFEQYTRVIHALAAEHPILLVLDDLQWADAGSMNLLFHLGRELRGSRVLIAGIYRGSEVALGRAGERHPLEGVVNELKRDLGDVEIDLGDSGSREFVDALLDLEANELGETFRETLHLQTGGHPLFTVELLQGMKEQGALTRDESGHWVEGASLSWEILPARVEAVIAERVGRLPEELRELLAVASVEGEAFTAEVLARVRGGDDRRTIRSLSRELDQRHRLVTAQGLRRTNGQRLSSYRFRHILFQKHLYGGLDPVERARLHEDVGASLEVLHGEHAGDIAVHLAHHFEEAGIAPKAVDYLRQAGEKAVRVSANQEAAAHFRRGLELLRLLPEDPERDGHELALRVASMTPLTALTGYTGQEVLETCERARELCERMGDTPQLFVALLHLSVFYAMSGQHRVGLELSRRCRGLAERTGDPVSVAIAHHNLGWLSAVVGEFPTARTHLEHMIAFYDPDEHRALKYAIGLDPGVASRSWVALVLWILGYPDQARERRAEALALARGADHPVSLALCRVIAYAFLAPLDRDPELTAEAADELIRISTEARLPYYEANGRFLRAWVDSLTQGVEQGIEAMLESERMFSAIGVEAGRSERNILLGEAYGRAGQPSQGLLLLEDGLAYVERSGEHKWESELLRLRGELLVRKDPGGSQAEESYVRALDVARRQEARGLELRATTSLARLWQKQGRTEEAREELSHIYGWFTEGFGTHDLKQAKALMDEFEGEESAGSRRRSASS